MTDGPGYEPKRFEDTVAAAYTLTCDAGHCNDLTVAVVLGVEGAWLSMCSRHASEELAVLP